MARYSRYGKATPSWPGEALVTEPKDVLCIVTKPDVITVTPGVVILLKSELVPQSPHTVFREHSPPR